MRYVLLLSRKPSSIQPFLLYALFILLVFCEIAFAQSGRVREKTQEKSNIPKVVDLTVVSSSSARTHKASKSEEDEERVVRIESMLIPIPVLVTDDRGRKITGLKAEDFIVEDNGKLVQIESVLTAEAVPLQLALLFDNSSSVKSAIVFEKKAAIGFLKKISQQGKVSSALFSISTSGKLEQPLTEKTSLVVQAIENLGKPGGATALFDTVIAASEHLKNTSGKRVIVIISDGDDNISNADLEETVRSVLVNNCIVYVIMTSEFENYMRSGTRKSNANVTFLVAERRMQQLAKKTGGAVYFPIDEQEMDVIFDKIAVELSEQYILNYYPEVESLTKGSIRSLSVKIKNRPDLIVRARKFYYVPN